MFSLSAVDVSHTEDDWIPQPPSTSAMYRAASVGNSWGVTSFGRGFNWAKENESVDLQVTGKDLFFADGATDGPENSYVYKHVDLGPTMTPKSRPAAPVSTSGSRATSHTPLIIPPLLNSDCLSRSPDQSPSASPRLTVSTNNGGAASWSDITRSPATPRARRRSSQKRVSLIAGRVSIAPIEAPSDLPLLAPNLHRADSTSSFLSVAASTAPPSPSHEQESFLGTRNISQFSIEGEIGRGAYGLVKRAREIQAGDSLGPPLIIKQIIKSRILADCWKKHPKLGTIPIEIYVMSAISSTTYVLPPPRPWDPSRLGMSSPCVASGDEQIAQNASDNLSDDVWYEGRVVKGHPNICALLDFFEDSHYYYLILPSATPGPPAPSDLFDLVESHPQGLPAALVRSYLGQIADALCFLHSRGIVHRDVKDENVVLGAGGKCILIDFGSAGLVKRNGWDTFSGTLDYAAPEILRGERYNGKEQDVWAFGVVAYVLLCGECPFMTAAEAREGLQSPFASASIALDDRCAEGKETEGHELDGGGALGDAAVLVRACLEVQLAARPTFESILQSQFLSGEGGWGMPCQ